MLLFLYDRPIATQLLVILSGEADASGTRSFLVNIILKKHFDSVIYLRPYVLQEETCNGCEATEAG